jgi:hypothetical protein
MRNDVVDSLIMGGSIAFVVLAINTLTDGTSADEQGLALLLAGAALAVLQLALTIRRARRSGPAPDQPAETARRARGIRPVRRNPFIRELNRDWTGLDDRVIESSSSPSRRVDATASDEPLEQPTANGQEATAKPGVGQDEPAEESGSG